MSANNLILDAKKAILEEQHRRLQVLREEGRWEELLQQLPPTLSCAADVLQHFLGMLHAITGEQPQNDHSDQSAPPA
jgi:hypothetical protein